MLLEAVAELCRGVRVTVLCGRLGDKPFGPVADLEGAEPTPVPLWAMDRLRRMDRGQGRGRKERGEERKGREGMIGEERGGERGRFFCANSWIRPCGRHAFGGVGESLLLKDG